MKNLIFYKISLYKDKDFEENSVGEERSKHMQIFIKSTNINNNSPIKILVDFKKTLYF